MVIDMSLFSKRLKRCVALILTLVLAVSVGNFGLMTQASAADYGTKKIYTILAEEYFSGTSEADAAAAGILASGALVGDQTVRISIPGISSIGFKEGKVSAKKVNSTYSSLRWTPYSCTVNGEVFLFDGKTNVKIGDPQGADLVVEYHLELTNLSNTLLRIPSVLLKEAKGQKSVLDRLSSSEEPYMGYMEKMTYDKMTLLYNILDPAPGSMFYGLIVLDPTNTQKDAALKNCFREAIRKIQGNCYSDADGVQMLTIYTLLKGYAVGGLSHYYKNYADYKDEINVFKSCLDVLLRAETRNGVYLSEEDKQNGIANMIACAKKYESYMNVEIPDFAVDFVALQEKMDEVDKRLTSPNSMINVNSPNLGDLTAILETAKEASSSSEQPTLRIVLTTESCKHEFEEGSNICIHCETECVIDPSGDDDGDGGDTPGDGGPGEGGGDTPGDGGSGETPGDEDPGDVPDNGSGGEPGENNGDQGGNAGSVPDGYSGAIYADSASDFESAMANANDGDSIRVFTKIAMTKDVSVNHSIKITGASKLDTAGHVLILTDVKASIIADGPLDVASGIAGYVPVKNAAGNTYTLTEMQAPQTSGSIAGSKTEMLSESRYLYLDLDPSNGMTLDALYDSMSFQELTDYTVEFSIEGNDGSGLVKTSDRLVVTALNTSGRQVAQIAFVVIVMGDTNCNGKVNSSDAAVTRSIGMGAESSLEVRMAADVNFSGTLGSPKVNSNDISVIMSKWFAWDRGTYVSQMK